MAAFATPTFNGECLPVQPTGDLHDATATTLRTAANTSLNVPSQESCLVQIYPPDVVDGMVLIVKDRLEFGRDVGADFVLSDASVSRRHAEIAKTPTGYFVRDLGSTNGTLVNGYKVTQHELNSGDTIRVGSFLFKFLSAGSIETQYHETVYGALTRDALTGAYNKRYFVEAMQREIARSMRQQVGLSVVMIDIDYFKRINDTYGHLAGDDILRAFGQRIASLCREDDMLARYGGEEFCLLLSDTDASEAREITERCRLAVSDEPFQTIAGELSVTASFGIGCYESAGSTTPQLLIEAADKQLYEAKRSGRNRVCG